MKAVFFATMGIILLVLTVSWAGGLIYAIQHHQEWSTGALKAAQWTLGLSGFGLLFIWGTWFMVGFRAMGAK